MLQKPCAANGRISPQKTTKEIRDETRMDGFCAGRGCGRRRGSQPLTADSSTFKERFPLQYERWIASAADNQTEDMIAREPYQVILRAGTGGPAGPRLLGLRGHFYSYLDFATIPDAGIPSKADPYASNDCLLCHSSVAADAIRKEGEREFESSHWVKYAHLGPQPVGCVNCHDPKTMKLALAPTWIDAVRKSQGKPPFAQSSSAEQKSLVCGQCHSRRWARRIPWKDEAGRDRQNKVSFAHWASGYSLAEMEAYYNDGSNFPSGKPSVDFVHPISRAPLIMSVHPDYELFQTGIHARAGAACTDCHMPKITYKGQKVTDHFITRPLKNFDVSCTSCHDASKKDVLVSEARRMKERAQALRDKTGWALAKAHLEAGEAWKRGATADEMKTALADIRASYFRFNSLGRGNWFHAPQETLHELADALNQAQSARLEIRRVLARHGAADYEAPEFSNKQQALALLNLPQQKAAVIEKCASNARDLPAYKAQAVKARHWSKDFDIPEGTESWTTRECRKP